jgi:hypothetical protein
MCGSLKYKFMNRKSFSIVYHGDNPDTAKRIFKLGFNMYSSKRMKAMTDEDKENAVECIEEFKKVWIN